MSSFLDLAPSSLYKKRGEGVKIEEGREDRGRESRGGRKRSDGYTFSKVAGMEAMPSFL